MTVVVAVLLAVPVLVVVSVTKTECDNIVDDVEVTIVVDDEVIEPVEVAVKVAVFVEVGV